MTTMKRLLSRRNVLRGAGVALTLPWMESLLPRAARAQATGLPKRYMPIYLPNGAPEIWRPTTSGSGAAWQLSSVLEPLTPLKAKTIILTNMENHSAFNPEVGNSSVEPSHGRQPGAWLTCVDPGDVRAELGVDEANNISLDQVMASHAVFKDKTALPSLQVGLSTINSNCDNQPCSNSRSISWSAPTQPMYKTVDPLEVFNRIVGVAQPSDPNAPADPEVQKRLVRQQSVIDAVLENANRTRARLGVNDQRRMDEFLETVYATEKRVTGVSSGMGGLACTPFAAPTMTGVTPSEDFAIRQTTETYNKGDHADVMNDLIVLAFQCDVTRIITYMLEDERSEFAYDHVTRRSFTEAGSVEESGTCPEYHNGGQHGSPDDFATITWWNVGKVAELCLKLDAIEEAPGVSILDNSVIFFGSCMHGSNHQCNEIPLALIGSGGGLLTTDQHIVYDDRPIRDLHYTVMNHVFGMGVTDFGVNLTGAPIAMLNEIMKTA
ncbi:MAG TPA: DUF1552 domain-containing protein [Polyangiaceae bacterium]|nr:DUF1552 domain-containing protein [Polyangiaceae bacterium]